jgi:[protein-PII] uridylyltransferase
MLADRREGVFSLNEPIARPEEVEAFLRRLPVAVDRSQFAALVLGFPRRYLEQTKAAEVVRHYALMRALTSRSVVSSLSRLHAGWRINVVARDRSFLFARIAGALSCFGLSIVAAEAFANANALVLDGFDCVDPSGALHDPEAPRRFQAFLEDVVSGAQDVEPLLADRLPGLKLPPDTALRFEWDDEAHAAATRLLLQAPDSFGLLYLVSRTLSLAGCNIEMAEIATPAGRALDAFYLTRAGARLSLDDRRTIERALDELVEPGS